MAIQVVILAAGQGKRMRSHLPKVLHPLGGKPLLAHVIDTALAISPNVKPIVICGHQSKVLQDAFSRQELNWVLQKEQLGTGHAVLQALPQIAEHDRVLVLSGDAPLIMPETLQRLVDVTPADAVGILTATLADATGYGRIKRNKQQQVIQIVEEKDAGDQDKAIREINAGIYLVPAAKLKKWLPLLKNNNAQGEYYLTDIIAHAVADKMAIHDAQPFSSEEIFGVNDRVQLAQLERAYQRRLVEALMRSGVTVIDPARLDIRGNVKIGSDVTIDVNVILEGRIVIGDGCMIGPNSFIRNTELADRVEIRANSMLDGAVIGADSVIGPFARIRPGTVLAQEVHIGNFVELKNTVVREATKINHLSYIGDSDVGKQVNVGAGTITCNYDGANKHKTYIGDRVQIGSGTQLVAPVTVGEGATLGAGSTLTKDAPPNQLTLTHRLEQRTLERWVRPVKSEKVEG